MSKEAKGTIRSEFAHVVRVFFRHKLGVVGLVMLVVFAGAAAFAPVVAPKDPYEMDLMSPFLPPGSPGYILGTDNYGRDILSRLIHGSRISLLIGIVVVSIATVIGSILSSSRATTAGGSTTWSCAWWRSLLLPIPDPGDRGHGHPGPQHLQRHVGVGRCELAAYARLVRAQVMALKSEDFVKAASALGAATPASCSGTYCRTCYPGHSLGHLGHTRGHTLIYIPGIPGIRSSASHSRVGRHGQRGQGLHPAELQHDYLARDVHIPRGAELQLCRRRTARRTRPEAGQTVELMRRGSKAAPSHIA